MRDSRWGLNETDEVSVHEASIVESLLRQVAEKAPLRAVVHCVHVRVGRLTGVSPDALLFYFEALRDQSLGEQCKLIVTQPSLCARCEACQREQEFTDWEWECPACKSGPLQYLCGSELELEAIEVEDDGDDSNRRENPGEERRIGGGQPEAV